MGSKPPEMGASRLFVSALAHHKLHQQVGNPGTSRARPMDDNAMIIQRDPRRLNGTQHCRDDDSRGALDVVIKRAVVVAVFVENPGGVAGRSRAWGNIR